jgi:large subunit ribosomal protein L10e
MATMAKTKPAKMYRQIKGQSYTRRPYMGGVPNPRITQFELGNKTAQFPVSISLLVEEKCQIMHNALEAARIAANRYIEKKSGRQNYNLKVRVYPHNVLRENKQATGAGADRISQGMSQAFGKNVGTAARVSRNQKIITISTTEDNIEHAKIALKKAGAKLPSSCKMKVENLGS